MTFAESLQGVPKTTEDTEMIQTQIVKSELENLFQTLSEKTAEIADKVEEIEQIKSEIKDVVMRSNKPFKCEYGTATITKGRTAINWDDEALLKYAETHPEVKPLRSVSIGKSCVSVKVI